MSSLMAIPVWIREDKMDKLLDDLSRMSAKYGPSGRPLSGIRAYLSMSPDIGDT